MELIFLDNYEKNDISHDMARNIFLSYLDSTTYMHISEKYIRQ